MAWLVTSRRLITRGASSKFIASRAKPALGCASLASKSKSRRTGVASVALQSHAALAEIRDSLLETYASNDAMTRSSCQILILVRGARPSAGSKRQRRDDRGHLRASTQQPSCVAEEFRAASEVSGATRSRPLHHEAGRRRAQEKRRAVLAHVVRRSLGRSKSPRYKVLARQLDAKVASRREHVSCTCSRTKRITAARY